MNMVQQLIEKDNVIILRLEQIYPFPYDNFAKELKRFANCEILWCQEEPKNMGAYGFIKRRIESVMREINSKQEKFKFHLARKFELPKRS